MVVLTWKNKINELCIRRRGIHNKAMKKNSPKTRQNVQKSKPHWNQQQVPTQLTVCLTQPAYACKHLVSVTFKILLFQLLITYLTWYTQSLPHQHTEKNNFIIILMEVIFVYENNMNHYRVSWINLQWTVQEILWI